MRIFLFVAMALALFSGQARAQPAPVVQLRCVSPNDGVPFVASIGEYFMLEVNLESGQVRYLSHGPQSGQSWPAQISAGEIAWSIRPQLATSDFYFNYLDLSINRYTGDLTVLQRSHWRDPRSRGPQTTQFLGYCEPFTRQMF